MTTNEEAQSVLSVFFASKFKIIILRRKNVNALGIGKRFDLLKLTLSFTISSQNVLKNLNILVSVILVE